MDSTRREFLKKGAAAGAVTWAAPAILSLPAGRAWAQYGGCPCTANAFGLHVIIPSLGINDMFGVGGCEATVAQGAPGTATVAATAVCSSADSDGSEDLCAAEASVAGLNVVVGDPLTPDLTVMASVLTSSARASCEQCGTAGGSSIASLAVDGTTIPVSGACNLNVGGLVIVNEQTCAGGTLSVNALHVTVPGVAEVIVAHSEAGAQSCPCAACA